MPTRKYLDSIEKRLNANSDFEKGIKRKVNWIGGYLLVFCICSLQRCPLLTSSFIACLVFGAYYLATGEYLF